MRINKKIVKRLVRSRVEIDGGEYKTVEYVRLELLHLPVALGLLIAVLVVGVIVLTLAYDVEKWLLRRPAPPPTVITRIIRTDALTAAQHEFIQQCEQNTTDIKPESQDKISHGVPDIHTSVWTCKFAQ